MGVALAVLDRLCVLDALPDPDGVCDDVIDPVPVPDPELVAVGVTERLGVDVVLSVPLSEPVLDALAPSVTDAVGVRETERDRLAVELGVSLLVGVPDDVPDPVGEPLDDTVLVPLPVPEFDGVSDALAPGEREEVCDGVCVAVSVVVVVIERV